MTNKKGLKAENEELTKQVEELTTRVQNLSSMNSEYLKENKKVNSDRAGLIKRNSDIVAALKRLLPQCPHCKKPASQWRWNKDGFTISCLNSGCSHDHSPLGGGLRIREYKEILSLIGMAHLLIE